AETDTREHDVRHQPGRPFAAALHCEEEREGEQRVKGRACGKGWRLEFPKLDYIADVEQMLEQVPGVEEHARVRQQRRRRRRGEPQLDASARPGPRLEAFEPEHEGRESGA